MKRRAGVALAFALFLVAARRSPAEAGKPRQAFADLTISAISAPSSTSPGKTIVVSSSILNQGKATSVAIFMSYYLSTRTSKTSSSLLLGVQNIGSLAADTSVTIVISLAIPSSTASGTFYVVGVADSAKAVQESNEKNNLASAPLQVLAPPSVSAVLYSPPIVMDGQSGVTIQGLKITSQAGPCVTIRNSSNIIIDASEIGPCAGNAVEILGSSALKVVNSSIHTEHDGTKSENSGLGVFVHSSVNVLVQGNQFAYNESSVYAVNSEDIRVIGNFSVNPLGPFPRGQHVQFNNVQGGMITENYGLSSGDTALYKSPAHQEDAINVWSSAFVEVRANYLVGGDSPSGCGIIADGSGSANSFVNNVVIRTAQCGVAIAGGTNHVIAGNKVLDPNIPSGSGNIGIYVWNQYSGPCSGHSVTGNDVSNLLPDGRYNDYWNGENCGTVSLLNNTWGSEARTLLTPESEQLPPPAIPPTPYVF